MYDQLVIKFFVVSPLKLDLDLILASLGEILRLKLIEFLINPLCVRFYFYFSNANSRSVFLCFWIIFSY